MKTIYLASSSPRRLQLLNQIGINPTVVVADFDENMSSEVSPKQLVVENAVGKAYSAAKHITDTNSLIIAADTIVVYDNKILGKPNSREAAKDMLDILSDNTHYVYTGVCVLDREKNKHLATAVETLVEMREINQSEMEAYLNTSEPYDKAGAYGIQQLAGIFVKRIAGSYTNIVGLPIEVVTDMLKKFNYEVFKVWSQLT